MQIKKILCLFFVALVFSCSLPMPTTYASAPLTMNAKGSDVIFLQKKLASLNYKITSFSGIFNWETKQAVIAFQRDHKLKITGTVDKKTWRALKKAKPKKPPLKTPLSPAKNIKGQETAPFIPQKQVPSIIKTAKQYIGTPYKFGGNTPKGFDCSGYLQYVFNKHKYTLPRSADTQYNIGKNITKAMLREGDLVFFSTYEKGPSHCGIYLGHNKFIHASSSKGIRIDELTDAYWQPRYLGAKRITK